MTPAIEVRGLSFSYHDGKEALKDIGFSVAQGECVGLIGPNGAGKSTLLRHLNGLLPEHAGDGGAVSIFGRPISRENLDEVHRRVGFLFQDPDDQIFCPTVFEDVAFGPRQFGMEPAQLGKTVAEALALVGLEGFANRVPHHLSDGEKQRVCLAGVLACKPDILVLDEPTSDLDPRGRRALATLLESLPVTKVIASHDLELVLRLAPRALLLDGGRLVADGPARTLLADEELMLAHGLEKPHSLLHLHPHGG